MRVRNTSTAAQLENIVGAVVEQGCKFDFETNRSVNRLSVAYRRLAA
jgi:hypothetical protein